MPTDKKNKDMLAAAVIFNVALINVLAISVAVNLQDTKLFTYGLTYRLNSRDPLQDMASARDTISNMYLDNKFSDKVKLGLMLDNIHKVAQCNTVEFDGGLRWNAGDVSPTCNCLTNMHIEYIKSVNPLGIGLNEAEMLNADTKNKTEAVVKAVQKKCFNAIRHTQVMCRVVVYVSDDGHGVMFVTIIAG
jgi:hypothetical protein